MLCLRSSHRRCSVRKGVLWNFPKFTGKHLCQSLSFNKKALLKKRLWHRCFPVNFAIFLRTPFIIEHLWWLLNEITWIKRKRWGRRSRITLKYFLKLTFYLLCVWTQCEYAWLTTNSNAPFRFDYMKRIFLLGGLFHHCWKEPLKYNLLFILECYFRYGKW